MAANASLPDEYVALRRRPTITASGWRSRGDGIIPFRMKFIPLDIEAGHLRVADLHALRVGPRIELALHRQTRFGRRGGDEFDHHQTAGQRRAPPRLGDMAEQPVLRGGRLCRDSVSVPLSGS